VRLLNLGSTGSVEGFRVDVSNTTADEAAFATVLAATAQNNGTARQEFVFPGGPVAARFVRFVALDNYGSATDLGLREIEVVRRQGWALVDQELEMGLRSIATPIVDGSARVLAALNIGTHASRWPIQKLTQEVLPLLKQTAASISTLLGPGVGRQAGKG
jgi:hypothetical protein